MSIKVVVMGDSIAEGQYLPLKDKPWPDLIDDDYYVINQGISNDTTRMMLLRFSRDVQDHEPDVVVVQGGHNDCNRWKSDRELPRVSPLSYQANLHEMVDRILAFSAFPLFCTLTPTQKNERYDREAGVYSTLLSEVAFTRGVPLIDVRTAFFNEPDWDTKLLLPDKLHLSAQGHRVYAATVQRRLDEEVRNK